MADVATLGLRIENGQVVAATDALGKLTTAGTGAEGMASKLRGAFGQLAATLGVGLGFREVLRETIDAQNAMAQLEAAVRATGGAAGRSVQQLDDLAKALQRTTTFSDEAVMGAESVLLTFNQIGGVTFDRAIQAATDLAAKFGGDLSGAAMQLGKALQEPGEALSVLQRQYRLFSEAEVESIKQMAAHGRQAEAQAVILQRLESRFRGSAAAARDTLGGALAGLKNAFGDLLEVSRGGSGGIVDTLNAIAEALARNATAIRDTAVALGVLAGAFGVAKAAAWGFALVGPEIAGVRMAIRTFRNDMAVAAIVGKEGFTGMAQASAYFRGTMMSLGPILGGLVTYLGPLVALGLTLKLIVDAIKNVRLDEEEIAGADLMSRYNEARAWVRMHGGGRAGLASAREHGFTDVYGTGGAGRTGDTSAAAAKAAKEFREAYNDRAQAIAQIIVLNRAHGESEHELRLVAIAQQALTEKMQNARKYTGERLVEMNRLADGLRDARIATEELAEADRREALAKAGAAKADAARLLGAESMRTMLKDMQRALGDFLSDVFNGGVASFRSLFDAVRGLWSDLLGSMAAQKLRVAFEGVLPGGKGGGVNTAALGEGALLGFVGALAGLTVGMFDSQRAAEAAAQAERELVEARAATFRKSYMQAQHEYIFPVPALDEAVVAVGDRFRELIRLAEEAGGSSAAQIPFIHEMWAAMEERARAEWALKQRELQQDYAVRAMRAVGMDAEADAAAFAQAQQRELAQAIRDGADEATQAALAETQRQEAIARTAEVSIAAAQKEADAAARRLATAQGMLDASKSTLAGLREYQAALRGLKGSPTTNLADSRAAFEAMATKALAGDQTAIAGISGAGQAFLDQSRAYNASGMGYQKDVAAVSAVIDALANTYQATVDAQQQMVDLLTAQVRLAAAALKALEDAEFQRQHEAAVAYYATAYTAAQAANDTTGMLAALGELKRLSTAQLDRSVTDLLALQGTLDVAMQGLAAQTIVALEVQRQATTAAFDAAAIAIVAGFPATDVSGLYSNAMAQAHQVDLLAAMASQASQAGVANTTLTAMLERLMWIADPSTRPQIWIGRPIDPNTGEPYGGAWDPAQLNVPMAATATNTANTVARLDATVDTLAAGFTELTRATVDIRVAVDRLTAETRRTGEALAVA